MGIAPDTSPRQARIGGVRIRLGTRGSDLARAQADEVAGLLRSCGHGVEIVRISTHGDQQTGPLASLGGMGAFAGALRTALTSRIVDAAVHSYKDLPTSNPEGLAIGAFPVRSDASDVLVARDGLTLAELPTGARIGTGSPRRAAMLSALRPDLTIVQIRGNVPTRLSRVGRDLDAVIVASAGLERLELSVMREWFSTEEMVPAPGQGIIAVECRTSDLDGPLGEVLAAIDDPQVRFAAIAEKTALARLEGGCSAAVGALCEPVADGYRITVAAFSPDGAKKIVCREFASAAEDPERVGRAVAELAAAEGAAGLVGESRFDHDIAHLWGGAIVGRRILLVRTDRGELGFDGVTDALVQAGAEVSVAYATRVVDLDAADGLAVALDEPSAWVVVTSVVTVPYLPLPLEPPVVAIGPATAAALRSAGYDPVIVGTDAGTPGLLASIPPGSGRVVLPGSARRTTALADGLTALGYEPSRVDLYTTVPVDWVDAEAVERYRQGGFDAVVVTSSSNAQAWLDQAGVSPTPLVVFGEATAATVRAWGIEPFVAETSDGPGLIAVLEGL